MSNRKTICGSPDAYGTSINDIDEIHLNHVLNRFLTFVELGYINE